MPYARDKIFFISLACTKNTPSKNRISSAKSLNTVMTRSSLAGWRIMKKFAVVFITLLLVCGLFAHLLYVTYGRTPTTRSIDISASKFLFEPSIIKVNRGDTLKITLSPQDVEHGFYLDGYEKQMASKPGSSSTLEFVADKAGKFSFRCSVTCGSFHPYMIGWLKVLPNYKLIVSLWLTVICGWLTLVYAFNRGKMLT